MTLFNLFGSVSDARVRDLTQLLGKTIDRVDKLEKLVKDQQHFIDNVQAELREQVRELKAGEKYTAAEIQNIRGAVDALLDFVTNLSTTGINVKLAYVPVDDEENPDGEITP